MSKGSKRRPQQVTEAEADTRWAAVFGTLAPRKADQALCEVMRAENLARATEQHAKDGN